MNPLLPLLGIGAGLMLLTGSKKASASTTTPGGGSVPTGTRGAVTTPPAGPRYYTVVSGDYPGLIAQKLTGDASRWLELTRANPQKPVWSQAEINALKAAKKTVPGSAQAGNFKTLYAGEKIILPESW